MNKDLQSKYVELQLLDQQIKQAQKQIELVENQVTELEAINQSLQEFSTTSAGTEILMPLSGGVFAKAELKDNKNLIVNVGAGTAVTKSVPDTEKLVTNQMNELLKVRDELLFQLQQHVNKAQNIQQELERLSKNKLKE
ncbi:MAG: prefoldin subunit alpha [Candidatus Woesearchaeota archaeon]|nr:prefoldin subunit alpha [Candidatus Woesearchaeota archaeon]